MTATISFNAKAAELLQGRTGGKLRMDVREGTMFVRPTDRKAGPHVLTEYQTGSKGLSVNIDEKQLEKLGVGGTIENGTKLNVVKDKYGWFALRADGDEAAERATVSIKAAKASNGSEGGEGGAGSEA